MYFLKCSQFDSCELPVITVIKKCTININS